jgi:hypothetical protein
MIDFQRLYKGICGLAHAHKAGTMAGHLGAAVVTGYFFGEDQSDLPKEIYKGIEGELKRVIAGEEAFWFNAKKTGLTPTDLFKPFPKEESKEDSIKSIATALQKNVGQTRQSGHNIIFASIAVRGNRSEVDNRSTTHLAHFRHGVFGGQSGSNHVDTENLLPIVNRRVDAFQHKDGGVVDQDVDATVRVCHRTDHRDNRRLVGHVGLHKQRLSTGLHNVCRRSGSRFLVNFSDNDRSPCVSKPQARRTANPRTASGHHDHLITELLHHCPFSQVFQMDSVPITPAVN